MLSRTISTLKSMMSSTSKAADLPTEIVEHIFSLVDPADRQACATLCKVNRMARKVATPLLYRFVGYRKDGDDEHAELSYRLQLLCRTLLENPSLAGHVERVTHYLTGETLRRIPVSRWILSDCDFARRLTGLDELNLPAGLCQAVIESLSIERSSSRSHPSDESYLIVLLLLCQNLHTLHLVGDLDVITRMSMLQDTSDYFFWGDDDPAKSIEAGRSRAAGVYSLAEIILENREINSDDYDYWFGAEMLEALFTFPNLKSLTTNRFERTVSSGLDGRPIGLLKSPVQTLKITGCFAKREDLEYFLPACGSLRHLSIEWSVGEDAYRSTQWPDLGEALSHWCPLLESLELNHEVDDFDLPDDDFMQDCGYGSIRHLEELKHLKRLTITKNALFGTRARGHGDSTHVEDEDPENFQVETDEFGIDKRILPPLANVLPASLRELTIICEGTRLDHQEWDLLHDPFVAQLDEMIVVDAKKQRPLKKSEMGFVRQEGMLKRKRGPSNGSQRDIQ